MRQGKSAWEISYFWKYLRLGPRKYGALLFRSLVLTGTVSINLILSPTYLMYITSVQTTNNK